MDGWNYFNYFTEIEEYSGRSAGASAGIAAGLGDHGGVAESRRASRSRSKGD